MPLSTLQRMLGYGYAVQSFSYLCEAHGIHCDIEENKVILKRKLFYLPQFPSIYRESYLIDSKLGTSVRQLINLTNKNQMKRFYVANLILKLF